MKTQATHLSTAESLEMGRLSWGEPGGSSLESFTPSVTLMESFCLVGGATGMSHRDRGKKRNNPSWASTDIIGWK